MNTPAFLTMVLILFASCSNDEIKDKSSIEKSNSSSSNEVDQSKYNSDIILFKEYKYGQEISEFANSSVYSDCSEEFGAKALCKEGVRFLNNDFSLGLLFNNERLEKVGLYAEATDEILSVILGSLPQNNFVPIFLSDKKNGSFDFFSFAKKNSSSSVQEKFLSFINNMSLEKDNQHTISLIDCSNMKEEEIKKNKNASELISTAPSNLRFCEISILHGEDNSSIIQILFYPLKMARIKEKF